MKTLFSFCIVLLLNFSFAKAAEGWSQDYDKALQQAKKEQKPVLLDFTGSDWCGWCIKLNKEVFSTPEFKEYAKKNLVLVEIDFPKSKSLPADATKRNDELMKQYKIEGFPTIVVLNSQGKQIGQLGYAPGGPKAFIAELEKLTKR